MINKNMTRSGNPDWKQLIPFYGFYKSARDYANGKPSFELADKYTDGRTKVAFLTYHALWLSGLIFGLEKIIEKIHQ